MTNKDAPEYEKEKTEGLFVIEIFVFLILVGIFFIDHRLARLNKTQTEKLTQTREITKALQWMVDNWKDESSKPPPV